MNQFKNSHIIGRLIIDLRYVLIYKFKYTGDRKLLPKSHQYGLLIIQNFVSLIDFSKDDVFVKYSFNQMLMVSQTVVLIG
jgi:hypothetical protein